MRKTIDSQRKIALLQLCESLRIECRDLQLLHQALTHTSYANESRHLGSLHNERLEFLGDAVLDLVTSEYLYLHFPKLPEGELTKARAILVCEQTLAKKASALKIGQYLLLGKGEALSGGRERLSILADTFESILGALYLDQGFVKVAELILRLFREDLEQIERGEYVKDYKTLLQEVVQKSADSKISYEVLSESGPDHDKVFRVAVYVNNQQRGTGSGKSKKEAEQQAAREALTYFNIIRSH